MIKRHQEERISKDDPSILRRRKILWIFLGVIFLFAGLHIVGVDAKAPELIAGIIETINPPKPIVKSTTFLPASVQASIENLAEQQIQQQNANATLPGSSNINAVVANVSPAVPLIDDIRIIFTLDPVAKAKLRLGKVDAYIAELENLLSTDRSTSAVNKALGFIQNIGNETEKITSDPKAQADRTVLTLLIQQYNRVQIILQKVEDTLPMSDYLKIEDARVKYVLGPAQISLNNASNLEVVNTIGNAEAAKLVGVDFAELKSIEILTDLSGGLSIATQAKFIPIKKELAAQFEKRMLTLPANVRQRRLDNYMNFSYGNPVNQVKAFNEMQGFLTDRQVILGIDNLKEIALQKLSDQITQTNDSALDNQFLNTVIKNPKDLEVILQMQLQKNNPKLENEIAKKTVEVFGRDPAVFKTAFNSETGENASFLDVVLTNYLQKTLGNDPNVDPLVKTLATDLKKSVLSSFTQNVNGIGFNTISKLSYNPVPANADVRILIPNPSAIKLLNDLQIYTAIIPADSILKEHILLGVNPEVFNEYKPLLNSIFSPAELTKTEEQVSSIAKLDNQKLFETVQQITQNIFLTDAKTSGETLLPDSVQEEISTLKAELPTRNIPQLTLPYGVTLPDVAKLPDDVSNAIVTIAEEKINEDKKPQDLKLNLDNLATDLGVTVPSILPDNPIYPIVEVVQKIELVLTSDPIARAELLLKQDNEKTLAAAKLVEDSQSTQSVDLALQTLDSVNNDFNLLKSHTDEIKTLETTESQKVDELVTQIVDNGLAQQTVFSEVESKVHGDEFVKIENVRSEVLTNGVDALLTLTNNDVAGLTTKLEGAVAKENAGTLSDIKAIELLNEIARTQPELTQQILQTSETKLASDLETKIESIPAASRTETVLAYANTVSANPVRELESYDVLKNNFTNPDTIALTEGMKNEAVSNLISRITEIPDAGTLQNFVDNIVGHEPQDLKAAIEIEANVAPLQTANTPVTEVLPIVQKVEDMKANVLENIINTYQNSPDTLVKADFFDNPTLNKTPDVVDIKVAQDLQTALSGSPEVVPAVVAVAKQEETKIINTFVTNISSPQFQSSTGVSALAAETLNPAPATLVELIDLQNQVPAVDQPNITLAINAQVNIMQTNLTTQITDPVVFDTYVAQIESNPIVAQTIASVAGASFTQAVDQKSQEIAAVATTDQNVLQTTVNTIEKEVFSAPITNPSPVQQTLPQPVQAEIQLIKKEQLPVAQIPAVTVEATVQFPAPAPSIEPAPVSVPAAPEPVAPAPEVPKVGL